MLEKQIAEKIDQNKAILLEVHSVSHQMSVDYEQGKNCTLQLFISN